MCLCQIGAGEKSGLESGRNILEMNDDVAQGNLRAEVECVGVCIGVRLPRHGRKPFSWILSPFCVFSGDRLVQLDDLGVS